MKVNELMLEDGYGEKGYDLTMEIIEAFATCASRGDAIDQFCEGFTDDQKLIVCSFSMARDIIVSKQISDALGGEIPDGEQGGNNEQ